ncbi:hypothetical protein C8Q76DRAFT_790058 [Earliella scabrosa]|nr:hypothetical protein C8Q76DRAFT_790058 [Earliella scabrosa]
MSSTLDIAAIVADLFSVSAYKYGIMATEAFVVHEHLLTFDEELELFWRPQKMSSAAVLFFANRYLILATTIVQATSYLSMSDQVRANHVLCARIAIATQALAITQFVPQAVFAALRALALSRMWTLSIFVFVLSIVPVGINILEFFVGFSGKNLPFLGCMPISSAATSLARRAIITSRTCLIASDLILICVTWVVLSGSDNPRGSRGGTSLATVLLRDGTIYFVVFLLLNSIHLTLSLLAIDVAFQTSSYITVFTQPITAVLISRFLLNLQSASQRTSHLDSQLQGISLPSAGSTISTKGFIGSLGSPLDPGLGEGRGDVAF